MSKTYFPLDAIKFEQSVLKRREFLAGAAALAGGAMIAACGGPSTTTQGSSSTTASKKYTLVFIAGIQGVPFYNMVKKGAVAEAAKLGATLQADAPAQWDPNLQTQIVNAYIAKKVDGSIISPCDSQVLVAPLKRANDAGIKVVTVDTFLGSGDYSTGNVTFPVAYIGSDNVKGGRIAGDALIKAIGGKGKVYLQNNAPGASTAVQRAQGFKDAIAATKGAVTLVAENFDGGDISKATAQTSAILQSHPDLVGIFGATAYSAEGAAAAAGLLNMFHYTSGTADAGDPLLIDSIAAVTIGGASLFGGEGSMMGTLVGALLIAVIQNGLVIVGIDPFWQFIAVGIVIILAVLVDRARARITDA